MADCYGGRPAGKDNGKRCGEDPAKCHCCHCGRDRWLVSKPEMPIHFISGADDPCLHDEARFNSAVEFLRSRGYRNVSAKLYPGMRHQILNEENKDVVWNDLLALLG